MALNDGWENQTHITNSDIDGAAQLSRAMDGPLVADKKLGSKPYLATIPSFCISSTPLLTFRT
jgi:hypothetical protein